ncbi:MAG: hypothetical protein R2852_08540 [Bacteroidia bacterium]
MHFLSITVLDFMVVWKKFVNQWKQIIPTRLSLSDENKIEILLRNHGNQSWHYEVVDELPYQLQNRDFSIIGDIKAKGNEKISYYIRPLSRGVYAFGNLNVFLMSRLRLVKRRVTIPRTQCTGLSVSFK